jgi:flavin-binding protein dodecin
MHAPPRIRRHAGLAGLWPPLRRPEVVTRTALTSPLIVVEADRHSRDAMMSDHIYKSIEITGSSNTSIDDAIKGAVERASGSVRNVGWFQVKEVRGQVQDGMVAHFQVTLKIGFRLDDQRPGGSGWREDDIPPPGTDALHEGP